MELNIVEVGWSDAEGVQKPLAAFLDVREPRVGIWVLVVGRTRSEQTPDLAVDTVLLDMERKGGEVA